MTRTRSGNVVCLFEKSISTEQVRRGSDSEPIDKTIIEWSSFLCRGFMSINRTGYGARLQRFRRRPIVSTTLSNINIVRIDRCVKYTGTRLYCGQMMLVVGTRSLHS